MSKYYWDNKIEYLRNTRGLYYNDDYLEFLVKKVWKIDEPVDMIDYGCGFGYMGLKLLPILPEGSTYTGVDRGHDLIEEAKKIFKNLPYKTDFIVEDITQIVMERQYDIALCHAVLLHMANPKVVLKNMINSVINNGKVICFETHRISCMSNYHVDGVEHSQIVRLGVLQKLYENDFLEKGKDGNIGIKLPIILSQLGLKNVECRVSDKVNYFDQLMEQHSKDMLYEALKEEGLGYEPKDKSNTINYLMDRGLTQEEANEQYEAELLESKLFNKESRLTFAPNMKITFGVVKR
ncbi:class I SAM-dependent methyltransferase [Vallitalea pronyensis]|uniref:Class I SAM-dependent methyltransferase n=1 Tax=Vallitalea pronyensis TaxID=1348613 RepID=A0A8J8SI96_9FIRM|nr:class I SAM-dependent methyltransferase [Vallitalea pronyensis]QUI24224.1 class I SAM-dependent methyltransferase [Vallitalea pronyensis]